MADSKLTTPLTPLGEALELAERWRNIHTDDSYGPQGKNLGTLARALIELYQIARSEKPELNAAPQAQRVPVEEVDRPVSEPAAAAPLPTDKNDLLLTPAEVGVLLEYHQRAADGALQQDYFNGERFHRDRFRELEKMRSLNVSVPSASAPIPMLLFCPRCTMQHVDAPEPEKGWTNPPHATHTCKFCGLNWRPSNHNTDGVASIKVAEPKHVEKIVAAHPATHDPARRTPYVGSGQR